MLQYSWFFFGIFDAYFRSLVKVLGSGIIGLWSLVSVLSFPCLVARLFLPCFCRLLVDLEIPLGFL